MSSASDFKLGDVCDVIAGQHIAAELYADEPGGSPYITGPADFTDRVPHISKWTAHPKVFAAAGDVLVTVKGAGVGKINLGVDAVIGRQLMALRPKPGILDQVYLFHFLRFQENYINGLASGATIPGIRKEDLAALGLRLPPLEEQRRIAVILDAADNLRAKRRAALAKLHKLAQSIFIDMFGDPALNTKNWPVRNLAELSLKFSDGPFGSNLKSQHYVQSGVRVIRLQNIGVGKFIDDDKAYISEPHFRSLQKHECLPGDVIVGTLGDPNLRACVLPSSVYPALNKADCVQIRPNESLANAAYICHLLNNPSTERMAQGLILGQTRLRISMGRLKQLEVPLPPLSLQSKFHEAVSHVEEISAACEKSAMALDNAFSSLQYRAFKGEL